MIGGKGAGMKGVGGLPPMMGVPGSMIGVGGLPPMMGVPGSMGVGGVTTTGVLGGGDE